MVDLKQHPMVIAHSAPLRWRISLFFFCLFVREYGEAARSVTTVCCVSFM
jgi:hypothetical protein